QVGALVPAAVVAEAPLLVLVAEVGDEVSEQAEALVGPPRQGAAVEGRAVQGAARELVPGLEVRLGGRGQLVRPRLLAPQVRLALQADHLWLELTLQRRVGGVLVGGRREDDLTLEDDEDVLEGQRQRAVLLLLVTALATAALRRHRLATAHAERGLRL